MTSDLIKRAAEARAQAGSAPMDRPRERRMSEFGSARRGAVRFPLDPDHTRSVERNGLPATEVYGYASTYDQPYSMYDAFGPYDEVTRNGMVAKSLAAAPLVEYTLNHGAGGAIPMAHTRNDTLDLGEDLTGFSYNAFVDQSRGDVSDMLKALTRGDLAEASFKFRITKGVWSPDWQTYAIEEVDLDGGDVSTVNFGANPNASSGTRSTPSGEELRLKMLRMQLDLALAGR